MRSFFMGDVKDVIDKDNGDITTCENCGKPVSASSNFCTYCGAAIIRSIDSSNESVDTRYEDIRDNGVTDEHTEISGNVPLSTEANNAPEIVEEPVLEDNTSLQNDESSVEIQETLIDDLQEVQKVEEAVIVPEEMIQRVYDALCIYFADDIDSGVEISTSKIATVLKDEEGIDKQTLGVEKITKAFAQMDSFLTLNETNDKCVLNRCDKYEVKRDKKRKKVYSKKMGKDEVQRSIAVGQYIYVVLDQIRNNNGGDFFTGYKEGFNDYIKLYIPKHLWPEKINKRGDSGWVCVTDVDPNNGYPKVSFSVGENDVCYETVDEIISSDISLGFGIVKDINGEIVTVMISPSAMVNVKVDEKTAEKLIKWTPCTISLIKDEEAGKLSGRWLVYNGLAGGLMRGRLLNNSSEGYGETGNKPNIISNGKDYPEEFSEDTFIIHQERYEYFQKYVDRTDEEIYSQLQKDYRRAYKNHRIISDSKKDDHSEWSFETSFHDNGAIGKAPIYVGFRKDKRNPEKWFVSFAGIKAKNIHKIMRQDIYVSDGWSKQFMDLAQMALHENWGRNFEILDSYLSYTYYGATIQDNKILDALEGTENLSIFNTGLVNNMYNPIYACLEKIIPEENASNRRARRDSKYKYKLLGFALAGQGSRSSSLGKAIASCFSDLPTKVNFIEGLDLSDLILDTRCNIILDAEHIIIDNLSRLPKHFLKTNSMYGENEFVELIDEAYKTRQFGKLQEYIRNNVEILRRLSAVVENAKDMAIQRCTWNYKTAIPIYYPAMNTISLIVPLALNPYANEDAQKADVALVLSKQPSGNYQGETILTLEMAYKDSRLITRPDSDWLNVSAINA